MAPRPRPRGRTFKMGRDVEGHVVGDPVGNVSLNLASVGEGGRGKNHQHPALPPVPYNYLGAEEAAAAGEIYTRLPHDGRPLPKSSPRFGPGPGSDSEDNGNSLPARRRSGARKEQPARRRSGGRLRRRSGGGGAGDSARQAEEGKP